MITKRLVPIDSVEKVRDLISIGATIHWGDWEKLGECHPGIPTVVELDRADDDHIKSLYKKFGFCVEVEEEIDGS